MILVVSDSHRFVKNLNQVVESYAPKLLAVLHLGDVTDDIYPLRLLYPALQFYCVSGNSDAGSKEPLWRVVELGGKKIFMTHGHEYAVKSGYRKIEAEAVSHNADICLFGHTHEPVQFNKGGIIFMNPGSISLPRSERSPSYGILDIEQQLYNIEGI